LRKAPSDLSAGNEQVSKEVLTVAFSFFMQE